MGAGIRLQGNPALNGMVLRDPTSLQEPTAARQISASMLASFLLPNVAVWLTPRPVVI